MQIKSKSAIEDFCLIVFAVLMGCAAYLLLGEHIYRFSRSPRTTELLTAVTTVCAITVGFLSTVAGILLSLDSRRVIRDIKESGLYQKLLCHLTEAVVSNVLAGVLSTAYILIDDISHYSNTHNAELGVWFGLCSWAALTCGRMLFTFFGILHLNATEK